MILRLVPLTLPLIQRLLDGERMLDALAVIDGALPPEFILRQAAGALVRGEPSFWHAPRLFADDARAALVGAGGYKGAPANGRVEIGYNVAGACRAQGYATAAVRQLVDEALARPGVAQVDAETAVDNAASRRVVEKAGFARVARRQTAGDGWVDQWVYRR